MAADASGSGPKLVLVPHERSHPFARRECVLSEPLKVGRSVDKRRISQNNLIFDCRVLSRNHALIWFRNGKFYIQDTKSSNGTFVNETRLSSSGEESGPVELKTRDIVQFGVNVNVEKKVTHGCIIGTIRLYIDEEELPGMDPPIQQVMQLVQSALSREQELEHKLACMQDVLNAARQLTSESMIAIVREDELMSRLEMLENQLQVYSRNAPEDELKKQLEKAFEEKHQSELSSKDSLRAILQEKLECVTKLNQLQRDYDKAEQECQKYRTLYDTSNLEHSEEVGKLLEQLRNAEKECKTAEEKLAEEKQNLISNIDSLQSDADLTREQLTASKARIEEMEEELVTLRIKEVARKQRKAAGLSSVSSAEGSLEFGDENEGTREGEVEESFKVIPEGSLSTGQPQYQAAAGVPQIVVENIDRQLTSRPGAGVLGEALMDDSSEEGEGEAARLLELDMHVTALDEQLRMSEENVARLEKELAHTHREPLSKGRATQQLTETGRGDTERLQDALTEAEEHIRSLQAELQGEVRKRTVLQETVGALGGQLSQCYSELEGRQLVVSRIQDISREKDEHISALQEDIERGRKDVDRLSGSNAALQDQLRLLQQESEEEAQRLRAENSELSGEIHRLEVRLGEEQEAMEKEKTKPHFLLRPGSPTADEQRVKLLTIIALVAIGVAVASWLT